MGLFSIFKNKKEIITPGQRLDKLDEDGQIPYGWYYENREFTKEFRDLYDYFLNEYINAKKQDKGIQAVRAALKSLVVYMEDVERICASKGECFVEWSKLVICDEVNMESRRNELKNIEDNLNELLEKEKLVKWLKAELLCIIEEEPGVVQSDLHKRFDPELKFEVSNQLYLLSAKGLITREKSGRSYKLYIC